jgi:hypothetical protein
MEVFFGALLFISFTMGVFLGYLWPNVWKAIKKKETKIEVAY